MTDLYDLTQDLFCGAVYVVEGKIELAMICDGSSGHGGYHHCEWVSGGVVNSFSWPQR